MARQLKPAPHPDKLSFVIGGYSGDSHALNLSGGDLHYAGNCFRHPSAIEADDFITPSPTKWRNFIAKLDAIGVWKWKKYYKNPHVLDGTQWEFEIVIGDKRVKSGGSNSYPGIVNDPECMDAPESSPEFDALLAALNNLTGKKIN